MYTRKKNRRKSNNWLLFLFFLISTQAGQCDSHPVLSGTVTDEYLTAISGVQVHLVSDDRAIGCSTKTNADGQFTVSHKPCKLYCLAVTPPKNSQLAAAWIDNLPGEESRKMVVELQHGYKVYGAVTHSNKGLKGLTVAIRPINPKIKDQKFVHGGGWAKTGKDGRFEMIVTAGLKQLTIINKQYPQLADSWSRDLTIHGEGVLENIELPEDPDAQTQTKEKQP